MRADRRADQNDCDQDLGGGGDHLPGTPPIVTRALVPRTLLEVPRSEIAEFIRQRAISSSPTAIHRAVLDAMGLTRLTERAPEYLDEFQNYAWSA